MYYDGELSEFQTNQPCQLLLMEDCLRITKINPYVEVKLEKSRIMNLDIFYDEKQYMAKYKGNQLNSSKDNKVGKMYYVLNYKDKNGVHKHLDFWGTTFETSKVLKLSKDISKNQESKSYEI